MKKLRLELEGLVVESFATARAPTETGTVRGQDSEADTQQYGCSGYCGTAEGTCAVYSCAYTSCYGHDDSCQCGVHTYPPEVTCGQQECAAGGTGHSGAWCTQIGCTAGGWSCISCPDTGCP